MSVVCQHPSVRYCAGDPPVKIAKRRAPHRKHFYTWVATDKKQLEATERLMLSGLSYYRASVAGLNTISTDDIRCFDDTVVTGVSGRSAAGSSGDVASTSGEATYTPRSLTGASQKDVLVLIHGFAGGVAGWAQNWRFFSEHYRVYAFDLPGFARSERRKHGATSVQEAMDYACGYLERWFRQLRFTAPVVILAHSFGCFVAAHFAMRSGSAKVKQLCLTEPWGMMRGDRERVKKYPLIFRLLLKFFYHVSPLALLRAAGPAGPLLLRRMRPDFKAKWSTFLEDTDPLYDYLYHCNAQRSPVGETLFQACCHYDVCAKEPLPDVLPDQLDRRIGVALLFGETSWLAPREAMEMSTSMREKGFRVVADTLPSAGHQIFTDNVQGFNEKILSMMRMLVAEPDTSDSNYPEKS